ncbi:hypothetical protein HAX54_016619, partial [Datura stramonium]|nr:hypothetical protein [Datura stramonium]
AEKNTPSSSKNGKIRRCKKSGQREKKVDNGRTKFSPGTCDDSESDPDVVFIRKEAVVTTGSGSGPTDPGVVFIGEEDAVTTGSGSGPTDPDVVFIGEEAAVTTGSSSGPTDLDVIFIGEEAVVTTGSGTGPIDPDVVIIGEEAESDSGSWSKNSTDESESEVSSDEDNDDSKDKNYQKKLNHGNCSGPILPSDGEESKSSSEEDREVDDSVQIVVRKDRRTRKKILEDSEFVKFVVDSIINVDDHDKLTPPEEKKEVLVKETLPLIFRFEDEEPLPPEKEDWEKRIKDLFGEMDMCILESHIGFTDPSVSPMQSGKLSGCQMGSHHLVLNEQIGLICKVCSHVHLESKYIFPPFARRTRGRRYERKYFGESASLLDVDSFRFSDSSTVQDSPIYGEGTVWDLVSPSAKETIPKFAAYSEQKWASLSSSIDKNGRALEELRYIISPLVHKCSENVKKVSLPGIRDSVIHLKPTDLQKELLTRIPENPSSFYDQNLVSLISVHPSLVANKKEFSEFEDQLKERRCRLDPDIGVKMKFVVELIRLCGGTNERVIISSQLLDPLNLIKEQLSSLFGWILGREILYMDGKLDVKQRQISINSLNDPQSDAKVLLASIKACSEGISLIGPRELF